DLGARIAELEAALAAARAGMETDTAALETSRVTIEDKRTGARDAETEKSRLTSEIDTLRAVLELDAQKDFRAVMEDIDVEGGFEVALSRALGDTLLAASDPQAPSFWTTPNAGAAALPALPDGARPLLSFVKAPAVLQRTLSQIGVLEPGQDGARLFPALKPGQSLVSREGHLWRWDGLQVRAAAADRHATHLRQKKRLQECEAALTPLTGKAAKTTLALSEALES
ncbi:MAG TPA: chromosome segregation protein SMC, partial [Alphaproteobacteria bacterium]|nr:chromosome segregation protein SMC [Alphaproteobacteria bacterium]